MGLAGWRQAWHRGCPRCCLQLLDAINQQSGRRRHVGLSHATRRHHQARDMVHRHISRRLERNLNRERHAAEITGATIGMRHRKCWKLPLVQVCTVPQQTPSKSTRCSSLLCCSGLQFFPLGRTPEQQGRELWPMLSKSGTDRTEVHQWQPAPATRSKQQRDRSTASADQQCPW